MDEALAVSRLRAAGCVFAEEEARLILAAAATPGDVETMVEQRARGLPLEQVIGWAEFCGLRIAVEPGVFVPRLRTEFLVRQAIQLIQHDTVAQDAHASSVTPDSLAPAVASDPVARPAAIVVDLCCGAGAIGAAIAAAVAGAEVHATDIDPAAVRCAQRNVPGYVYQGDLYAPLPPRLRGRVAVLAANVPYVPTAEIAFLPPEARTYEPRTALDGGPDGLDMLRRVAAGAPRWLAPSGHLLIETSDRQAPQAAAAFAAAGLIPHVVTDGDLGATVLIGSLAAVRH